MKKALFAVLMLVLFCGTRTRAQQIPSPSTSVSTQQLTLLPQTPLAVVNTVQESPSIQGNATYYYWFVSNGGGVVSPPAGPFPVFNAPATLGGINTITVTWNPAPGVTTYDVLRTVTSATPTGACGCAVITTTAKTTLVDNIPTASLSAYTVSPSPNQVPLVVNNLSFGGGGTTPSLQTPNTWGPGLPGVGALQTFTHPTGGSNNQYEEFLFLADPNLTFDRHLFGVCSAVPGNNCIGKFYIGNDNDENVVMSWDSSTTLAIVGAQNYGSPLLLYTPTSIPADNTLTFQQDFVSNVCVFNITGQCTDGRANLVGIKNPANTAQSVIVCANAYSAGAITGSCMPNTVYSAAGAIQNSEATHIVQDTATLAAGTATVTFTGPAAFASATSYTCTANDQTAAAAVKVTQTSGTSVTFTGTSTDVIRFNCIGN